MAKIEDVLAKCDAAEDNFRAAYLTNLANSLTEKAQASAYPKDHMTAAKAHREASQYYVKNAAKIPDWSKKSGYHSHWEGTHLRIAQQGYEHTKLDALVAKCESAEKDLRPVVEHKGHKLIPVPHGKYSVSTAGGSHLAFARDLETGKRMIEQLVKGR